MEIVIINIMVSIVVYLGISVCLIIIDKKTGNADLHEPQISFNELIIDYSGIPELNEYRCRDGQALNYRYYPSQSKKVIIFIHGSGWHSRFFFPLANYTSSHSIAKVYTPDLRGHGISPKKRGDIDYINQFEDDLADFIAYIKKEDNNSDIILAGHSSGGGLAIRFTGGKYSNLIDSCLLLSPYLKYNAPTMKKNSGGWTIVHTPRIIGLSMLNIIGIKWLNYLKVIEFNMPKEYRDGSETLSYSYRLNTGFAPKNYRREFRNIKQRTLLIAGESDESFDVKSFAPEIKKYKKDIDVEIISNITHMGVVIGEEVRPIIKRWVNNL